MKQPMPFIAGEIRKWLLEQPSFVELLHGGKVSTRFVPNPLKLPHVLVATTGMLGEDPTLRKPIVQVTPWVPKADASGIDEDPQLTAWNLAAHAGELLGRARNIQIDQSHSWSARWMDGPVDLYDLKRGYDTPLFYAPVRFAVTFRRR